MEKKEVVERLKEYSKWELKDGYLTKIFSFDDFMDSVNFVNEIAPIAEKQQHHPDLTIEYNKVTVRLRTHDQDSITEKDFELVNKIERL